MKYLLSTIFLFSFFIVFSQTNVDPLAPIVADGLNSNTVNSGKTLTEKIIWILVSISVLFSIYHSVTGDPKKGFGIFLATAAVASILILVVKAISV